MPSFFVTDLSNVGEFITITGPDAHHISRSLRIRAGEALTVCDGRGTNYSCTVDSVSDTDVRLKVTQSSPSAAEPPYSATVYQALVKGDKMDTVIQKAVELGAVRIVPFSSSRCTVKLEGRDTSHKVERWNRIALEAAKQCGRGVIPSVSAPVTFREMLASASDAALPLFCFEEETLPIKDRIAPLQGGSCRVSVVIGPEGGFSEEEAAFAIEAGLYSVSLGHRILRTESAAQFVLAALSYALEL